MRPFGSPRTLERRRRKALRLLKKGLNLHEVAHRVQSSASSVLRWKEAYAQGGDKALAPKQVPGRPRKLDDKECERLLGILVEGAIAAGFPNNFWTLKRIAVVIRREFGVEYHPSHIWKILRRFRWSCQVPERRAIQRDEEAIDHWKQYKWPALKKTRKTWGPPRLH